jgi:tRNA A-37 threonylcarbamoyl transferase component Bud32
MQVIKELVGYSNCKLEVIQDNDKLFVRKYGGVDRNIPQLEQISKLGLRVPEIYNVAEKYFDMEYVISSDMKSYLSSHRIAYPIDYITHVIKTLSETSTVIKDYSEIYSKKLSYIDQEYYQNFLPFNSSQLINRLPKHLPQSCYHGDLTLENIIYDVQAGEFLLIDAVTIEYDSFVFDLAKLRQDLTCRWFIRHESVYIDQKLQIMLDSIFKDYQQYLVDELVIAMLLRVLLYAPRGSFEEQYLINWIKKLWN